MATGIELATAYISLIPELKGAGKSISSQLARVDTSRAGKAMGSRLSKSFASAIDAAPAKAAADAVAEASRNVGAAQAAAKASAQQLAIAQQRLVEVQAKHAVGSSQVTAAQTKAQAAETRHAAAANALKSAEDALAKAQADANRKTSEVERLAGQASKGYNAIKGAAAGATDALKRMGGAFRGVRNVAVGAGIAAAGSFAAIAPSAVAATDATDKFKSTLDFAGLDTDEIDRLAESTKAYADQTVYDTADIQNVTAQLAANGVEGYEELAKAAGNLNAVTGGNKETFKSVAMVMTQTAGAGKLTTENWNQLADAIPGASGKLQEAMLANGAYTGNFREAMEKGEITAEEFNAAIMELGMTDVAQEAATSTKTFEGAFGVLESSARNFVAEGLERIRPGATDAMNSIAEFIDGAWAKIDAFVAPVKEAWGSFVDQLKANGAYDDIKTAIDGVSDAVGAMLDGAGKFVEWATQSETAKAAADGIKSAIDAAKTAVDGIKQALEIAAPVIGAAAAGMTAYGIACGIAGVINGLKDAIMLLRDAQILQTAAQWAMNAAMSANPIMLIITLIAALIGALVGLFMTNENFRNGVINAWNSITAFLGGAVERIREFFTVDIPNGINNMVQWFRDLPSKIKEAFDNIVNGVKQWASDMAANAMNAAEEFGNNLMDGIRSLPEKVVEIGSNIIDGLKNGILDGAGRIVDSITGVVNDAIAAAKDLLGIHSPSRVFRGIGDYTMQGFELGISDGAAAAGKAMDDAVSGVIGRASDARVSASLDMGIGAYDMQPAQRSAEARAQRTEDLLQRILYAIPDMDDRSAGRWVRAHA